MSPFHVPGPIHSFTEAYLYVCVTPCHNCGIGRLVPDTAQLQHDTDRHVLSLPITCQTCEATGLFKFDMSLLDPNEDKATIVAQCAATASPVINPTESPSAVIDVAGWLKLYALLNDEARVYADKTHSTDDRATIRRLHLQASACLSEALKFYDEDNDLPPTNAFFSKQSQKQFHQHPEVFVRNCLIELRAKLPIQHSQR